MTKFEIEKEKTKLQITRKLHFLAHFFFWLLNDQQDNFHNLGKFSEIPTEKIEENQRQSQIITGEPLLLWIPSLLMKTIFLIYTAANNSAILAHYLLNAFNDIEK